MKFTKVLFFSTSFTAGVFLIAGSLMFAQDKKISEKEAPKAVLNSFHMTYPKAVIKGMSTETEKGKAYFEIESIDGNVKRDLLFTSAGKIAEIEETISTDGLPKVSIPMIENKIPGAKVKSAEKVTRGSNVTYELAVTGKKGKFEVVLNKEGKIIKSQKVSNKESSED